MRTADAPIDGRRVKAGAYLIFLIGLALLGSAVAKLAHLPRIVDELGAMGFTGGRLTFVALLEIASALLFALRPTRPIGLLLVSSYMGGAIATHLQHAQPILAPSLLLLLVWFGAWLRHPELLGILGQGVRVTPPIERRELRRRLPQGSRDA